MLQHLLGVLAVILSGSAGTWLMTEVAKKVDAFNLSNASADVLRAIAGGMALVATLLLGLANHDVQPTDLLHGATAVVTFISMWLGSHNLHNVLGNLEGTPHTPAPPTTTAPPSVS